MIEQVFLFAITAMSCSYCDKGNATFACIPCGHLCICDSCADGDDIAACPECHSPCLSCVKIITKATPEVHIKKTLICPPKQDPASAVSANVVIALTDYAESEKTTEAAHILYAHEQIKRVLFWLAPNFNSPGVVTVDVALEVCQVSVDSETIALADVDDTLYVTKVLNEIHRSFRALSRYLHPDKLNTRFTHTTLLGTTNEDALTAQQFVGHCKQVALDAFAGSLVPPVEVSHVLILTTMLKLTHMFYIGHWVILQHEAHRWSRGRNRVGL